MHLIPVPVIPAHTPIRQCSAFLLRRSGWGYLEAGRISCWCFCTTLARLRAGQTPSSPKMDQESIACLQLVKINSWLLPHILHPSFGNWVWESLIKHCHSSNAKTKLRVALNLARSIRNSSISEALTSLIIFLNHCATIKQQFLPSWSALKCSVAEKLHSAVHLWSNISGDGEGEAHMDRYSHGHIHRHPHVSSTLTAGRLLWHTGFGILSQLMWWLSKTV